MIKDFEDGRTEELFHTGEWDGLAEDVKFRALKLLDKMDNADAWQDLVRPPGTLLVKVPGTSPAVFALHVRDRHWLTFRWEDGRFCAGVRLGERWW